MVYDQNTVHTLYKKLLNFYPRGFSERLGESMQQTFHALNLIVGAPFYGLSHSRGVD